MVEQRCWGRKAFCNNKAENEQKLKMETGCSREKSHHAQETEGDGDMRLMVSKAQIRKGNEGFKEGVWV